MSLITFIIPSIGRPTLQRAIDSLLAQSNPNWRAIIVFDGLPATQQFTDPRISVIESVERLGAQSHNGNAGMVRNLAFPHVQTEWVGFLDDDDTLRSHYVEYLAQAQPSEDFVLFRMQTTSGYIIPQVGSNSVVLNDAGISFCVRMTKLRTSGQVFVNSNCEDFVFMNTMINNGFSYQVNPEIVYNVRF